MSKTILPFIILLSLIIGYLINFTLPNYYITLILLILSTFSLFSLRNYNKSFKVKRVLIYILLFLMGSILLFSFSFVIDAPQFKVGLVLLSVMPPAFIIIPYNKIFKGDQYNSFISFVLCYILVFLFLLFNSDLMFNVKFSIFDFMFNLIILIFTPFILAMYLNKVDIFKKHADFFIYLCLFILFTASFSSIKNSITITSIEPILIFVFMIKIILSFLLFLLLKSKFQRDLTLSSTFFFSFKNTSLAIGLALMFFDPLTTVPAIFSSFMDIFILFLLNQN